MMRRFLRYLNSQAHVPTWSVLALIVLLGVSGNPPAGLMFLIGCGMLAWLIKHPPERGGMEGGREE